MQLRAEQFFRKFGKKNKGNFICSLSGFGSVSSSAEYETIVKDFVAFFQVSHFIAMVFL